MSEPSPPLELAVRNDTDRQQQVYIEPWGRQHSLEPDETVPLTYQGEPPNLQLDLRKGGLAIWVESNADLDFPAGEPKAGRWTTKLRRRAQRWNQPAAAPLPASDPAPETITIEHTRSEALALLEWVRHLEGLNDGKLFSDPSQRWVFWKIVNALEAAMHETGESNDDEIMAQARRAVDPEA